MLMALPMALFLSVGAVALFSFIAVAVWSDNRRKEREAFYKAEVLKKVAEAGAIDVLREQERINERKRREGLKLGGLITAFVGLGLGVALFGAEHNPGEKPFLMGAIPLAVGIALLVYVYALSPEEPK